MEHAPHGLFWRIVQGSVLRSAEAKALLSARTICLTGNVREFEVAALEQERHLGANLSDECIDYRHCITSHAIGEHEMRLPQRGDVDGNQIRCADTIPRRLPARFPKNHCKRSPTNRETSSDPSGSKTKVVINFLFGDFTTEDARRNRRPDVSFKELAQISTITQHVSYDLRFRSPGNFRYLFNERFDLRILQRQRHYWILPLFSDAVIRHSPAPRRHSPIFK